MTLSPDNFTLPIASWTGLREQVVIPSSEIHFSGGSTLTLALLAGNDIVRVLRTRPFTMRTGYYFLNQRFKLLSQIEVFELQHNSDVEFRTLHHVKIKFVVNIGIVELLSAHSIVQELLLSIG